MPDRTGKRTAEPLESLTSSAGATASTTASNRSSCAWACGVQRTSTQASEIVPHLVSPAVPDAVPVNWASNGAAKPAPRTIRRVVLIGLCTIFRRVAEHDLMKIVRPLRRPVSGTCRELPERRTGHAAGGPASEDVRVCTPLRRGRH